MVLCTLIWHSFALVFTSSWKNGLARTITQQICPARTISRTLGSCSAVLVRPICVFFLIVFFCHSGQLGVRGMILWKIGGPANRSFVKSYPVQCRPHVFEKFLPRSFLKASNDSCLNGSIAANISITCNSVDLCSTCHQESCVKKMMSNLACNLWHQQCHVFDKKNAKL